MRTSSNSDAVVVEDIRQVVPDLLTGCETLEEAHLRLASRSEIVSARLEPGVLKSNPPRRIFTLEVISASNRRVQLQLIVETPERGPLTFVELTLADS